MMMDEEKVTTFKIFVGNIPDESTGDDIRKIFEEFGTVVECARMGKTAFVVRKDILTVKTRVNSRILLKSDTDRYCQFGN